MMLLQVLSRDKLAKYGMSGMVGALVIMLGFTVMAALNGMGGHSHGGGGGHADHASHGHAHDGTPHGHQVNKELLSGNSKFSNHVQRHERHFDDADDGILKPYDHFHEEYDLEHGDHVHHIGPHNTHRHGDNDDDFHLDTEDYSTEQQDKSPMNIMRSIIQKPVSLSMLQIFCLQVNSSTLQTSLLSLHLKILSKDTHIILKTMNMMDMMVTMTMCLIMLISASHIVTI